MGKKHRELWQKTKAVHAMLLHEHPDLFDLKKPIPFAIGIYDELLAAYPEIPRILLHNLLRWLTMRRAYLVACKDGAKRWGLIGPNGTVSTAHAKHAKDKFMRRNETAFDKWQSEIAA